MRNACEFRSTLAELRVTISTGRVVDFRAWERIQTEPTEGSMRFPSERQIREFGEHAGGTTIEQSVLDQHVEAVLCRDSVPVP